MLVETNGTRLNVVVDSEAGEPVIFLHFGTGQLGVWDGVVPFFTGSYRVVRVDLRGHGQSEKPANGYTLEAMAQDILGVMDALGIKRAHLVGSSLGSEVALTLAALEPDRVISLALEGLTQNPFGPHSAYGEESEAKKAELRAARAKRRGGGDALLFPAYAIEAYMESFWKARFDQLFEQVNCPVLLLPDEAAMKDAAQRASVEWFRSLLRICAVVEIPGAQHAAVVLDQPERFARAVLRFYRNLSLLS